MKADITRSTFDPRKHYAAVLLQQGRVPLDADYNEQADLTLHRQEVGTLDLVGPCGAPLHDDGFRLVATAAGLTPDELLRPGNANPPALAGGWDFYITAGRIYVDGLLCENERILTYSDQPDYPGARLPLSGGDPQEGTYLAYLDVWRRGITALEDPSIREVALGGPDTATRAKTIARVRLFRLGPAGLTDAEANCLTESAPWESEIAAGTGRVAARAEPGAVATGPCIVAPGAGYRRLENQLYRLEVHDGGTLGTATFKWSRENGSVVARWESQEGASGENLLLTSTGRDSVLGFASGQWVELTDDTRELRGESGTLVQVVKVEGNTVTIDPATATGTIDIADFPSIPKVRRWDQTDLIQPADAVAFHDLEGGVQVRFETGDYRPGDYWLIPARTVSGDIEWERDAALQPLALPPKGVVHHHCRLAVMRFDGTAWTAVGDCRRLFPPATELITLDYVGGGGQEAMPGQPLPSPLQVRVLNGRWPVIGRRVRFSVLSGNGTLTEAQPVTTAGPDGLAECHWTLGSTVPSVQRVSAVLLDAADAPIPGQIVLFDASQSVASNVAYAPGNCPTLAGQTTVQAAIDRIAQVVSLYPVTGDGQVLLPGGSLQPLVVQAASLCQVTPGITVQWQVLSGGGSVAPAGGPTNVQGRAQTSWTLGPGAETQEVEARLVPAAGQVAVEPSRVVFSARRASEGTEAGVQVLGVRLEATGTALTNGMVLTPPNLAGGLTVVCSGPIEAATVRDGGDPDQFEIPRDQPTCFVTVEVPYPLTPGDLEDWSSPAGGGFGVVGYRPVVLLARTDAAGTSIVWRPPEAVIRWLQAVAFRLLTGETGLDRFLARLTLKGNFITAAGDPNRYLDGETFRNPASPFVRFPSGNGRRGGDFEMWFWVQRSPQPSFLAIQPQTLPSGVATGTLSFISGSNPAPTTVRLTSSQPNVASVAATVVLPAGASSLTFPISVVPGTTQVTVTITAEAFGASVSQTLTRTRTVVIQPGGGGIVVANPVDVPSPVVGGPNVIVSPPPVTPAVTNPAVAPTGPSTTPGAVKRPRGRPKTGGAARRPREQSGGGEPPARPA